ncbi:prepilin-type N-terminal cleavage/methylation domain-containing protein [Candidatus Nomurabacteria bacterium]|nr:prepilin-type N-terminal cleavage/methylation domain-containing protein [Candidatus Nomurabacteria bacterium]
MKFFLRKFNKSNRGFTFVETLVALSIFTLSVLAMISVLSRGIADTGYVKRKMIASYLAQEGVEYIRNLRDTYVLFNVGSPQEGWNTFQSRLTSDAGANCDDLSKGCYFDDQPVSYSDDSQPILDMTIAPCNDSRCSSAVIYYQPLKSEYSYDSSGAGTVDSGFRRSIKITVVNANEMKVEATVFWTESSGNQQTISSGTLFNWI